MRSADALPARLTVSLARLHRSFPIFPVLHILARPHEFPPAYILKCLPRCGPGVTFYHWDDLHNTSENYRKLQRITIMFSCNIVMSQQPDNFNPHRDVTQSESGDCEVAAAGIVIYL